MEKCFKTTDIYGVLAAIPWAKEPELKGCMQIDTREDSPEGVLIVIKAN